MIARQLCRPFQPLVAVLLHATVAAAVVSEGDASVDAVAAEVLVGGWLSAHVAGEDMQDALPASPSFSPQASLSSVPTSTSTSAVSLAPTTTTLTWTTVSAAGSGGSEAPPKVGPTRCGLEIASVPSSATSSSGWEDCCSTEDIALEAEVQRVPGGDSSVDCDEDSFPHPLSGAPCVARAAKILHFHGQSKWGRALARPGRTVACRTFPNAAEDPAAATMQDRSEPLAARWPPPEEDTPMATIGDPGGHPAASRPLPEEASPLCSTCRICSRSANGSPGCVGAGSPVHVSRI